MKNKKFTPTHYNVGQNVTVTPDSFENILNASRSIHAYPSSSFVEKIKNYVGKRATVSHTFRPGYEITIRFEDGQHFHAKDSWIEERKTLASVKIFLADGTNYETSVNANSTDENLQAYFVGQIFDRGAYPFEKLVQCTRIEIDRS